jgi:hypothetical protein
MEVDVKMSSMTAVTSFALLPNVSIDGVSSAPAVMLSKTPTQFDMSDFSGVFRTTETLKIPSGSPVLTSLVLRFDTTFSGVGGATVELGRCSWRRVN